MRGNLKKCIKKWTAAVVSTALIFSASPVVVSKVAEAETMETTASETMRNVCFGTAKGMSVSDASKVTFSIYRFDKRQNVSSDDAKVSVVQSAQNGWVRTLKGTDTSLGAHISDTTVEKITAVRGYEDYDGYESKVIHIEHKSGVSVLSDATQTSAVIADSANNVIYYGKLNDATASISDFKLPKGLTQGKYKLYVFAEKVASYTDTGFKATATDIISDIGEPIEIEVLDALKLYVGVDWPEFDGEPDTTANIYVSRDNDYSETVSGSAITWSEENSSDEVERFEFNKKYTAETELQTKEEIYMSDNVEVFFGNKEAEVLYLGSGNLMLSYTFDNITIEKIIIGGEYKDGEVVLNAYFDTSKPVKVDASRYDCKWILGLEEGGSQDNDANCNASEFKIDPSVYNSYIKVNVSVDEVVPNAIITSAPIKVDNGKLNVDFIVGVNKNDETYRGKKDGVIYGMKSGMSCINTDSGKLCQLDADGAASGLSAGKYNVSIDTSDLQSQNPSTTPNTTAPAQVLNEVYAEYEISAGRGINVGFNSNGGSSVQSLIGISYGEKINEPAVPKKEGYIFKGWYKSFDLTETWDFANDIVENDVTLYAKWEKNVEDTGDTGNTDNDNNTGNDDNNSSGGNTGDTNNGGNTGDTNNGSNTGGSTGSSGGGMANYPTGGSSQTNTNTPASSSVPSSVPSTKPVSTAVPSSAPEATPAPSVNDIPSVTPDTGSTDNSNNDIDDINNNENNGEKTPVKVGEKATVDGTKVTIGKNNTVWISGIETGLKTPRVYIPDTVEIDGVKYKVTKIEKRAFSGSDVESITIGNNVTTLGTGAFKNCSKLTTVSLPNSLTTIGKDVFKNCKSLTEISLPSNVKKLGVGSFENCENIKSMKLPSSVKTIGNKAFKNCKSLKKFTIGEKESLKKSSNNKGLKRGNDILLTGTEFDDKGILLFRAAKSAKVSIGASALENCINLRSVIINSQVTKIGNSTFKNCVKLASILVKSLKLKKVGNKSLKGVSNCKISVPSSKFKPYSTLFKNKGQGKKVVIAKS